MCCCIPDTPIEDSSGRIKVYEGEKFQTDMMNAPFTGMIYFGW